MNKRIIILTAAAGLALSACSSTATVQPPQISQQTKSAALIGAGVGALGGVVLSATTSVGVLPAVLIGAGVGAGVGAGWSMYQERVGGGPRPTTTSNANTGATTQTTDNQSVYVPGNDPFSTDPTATQSSYETNATTYYEDPAGPYGEDDAARYISADVPPPYPGGAPYPGGTAYTGEPPAYTGAPAPYYGPPQPAYGPPQQAFGPPPTFGPPQQAFGPPGPKFNPNYGANQSDLVPRIHAGLARLGYEAGPAQNIDPGRFSNVIRRYQDDHSLSPDGRISVELMRHVEAESGRGSL